VPLAWVAFHLTERCGLRCLHCLRDPAAEPADLPVATVARVLEEAARIYGMEQVALTGGEPTLHPELPGVVAAIVARGLTYHLVTSGVGFERLLAVVDGDAAARRALTCVNVSVDGASAETHDAIRGPGTYRRALEAVAACRARELPLAIQYTANALNDAELERAALAAAELGAARFQVGMTQPTGTPDDRRLALPAEGWWRLAERVERLASVLRIPVVANEGFPRKQPFHTCAAFAGELLHVDPHGRLSLCCQHSGVPSADPALDAELSVDLAGTSLAAAHARLLDVVHRTQRERLAAMDAGTLGPWDRFSCNACLKRFGKPHWTDDGAAGAQARRGAREGQG
jgi:MoaA/NifB/PqqE/SkfB family radical SAM enzyme